ncbi:MAG: endonuclease III [bacterium]
MDSEMKVKIVFDRLKQYYSVGRYRNEPFKVLIATVLSQRTRDENTHLAVKNLFAVYKTPLELSNANLEHLQSLIKPTGFYRVKASRIKEISGIILEKYNGDVPDDVTKLLSLPGVGRKTANCVLAYGFGKPAIPVDTHVHRISNRLGLVKTKSEYETEKVLEKTVPIEYWIELNELLVKFGQDTCQPVRPKCSQCNIKDLCEKFA